MTDQDLIELRREKWRLNGQAVRTLDDARAFIESVGFCLMYPMAPPVLAPTFLGAWAGSNEKLPTWQHAYADPRAHEATDLMVRLLREHAAYEANLFDDNNAFLVAASVFPYFYALVGERNPKQPPKPGPHGEPSQLVCDVFEAVRRDGPVSKQQLRETLGGGVSLIALDHALGELWSKLRITRVNYKSGVGGFWDVLYRWSPDAVREGISLSVGEALSALISKYLTCVIAADETELEAFFGNFVPRSRVKETVNALVNARELSFLRVGNRSLIQITPTPEPVKRDKTHTPRRASTPRRA
jgi:hypothetical protein